MEKIGWMVCAAALLSAARPSGAAPAAAPAVPEGGAALLAPDAARAPGAFSADGGRDAAVAESIAVDGMPFSRALRVQTFQRPARAWDILLRFAPVAGVEKGDVCLLSFYVRGPQSANESGDAVLGAYVQRREPPNRKLVSLSVTANRSWRRVVHAFAAGEALAPGQFNVVCHLGYHPQTVEIAEVRLVNYGRTKTLADLPRMRATYAGREADAPWRREAQARIEQHRKGDLVVAVVDAAGRPVPNARVSARMTRHAFGFGAAVVARRLADPSEEGRRYREVIEQHYTKAVFENDLKWQPWETSKSNTANSYRREWTDAGLAWLRERHIAVRGHYITWAPIESGLSAARNVTPEAYRERLFAHIDEKVPAVGDRVVEWDAINHIVGWGETLQTRYGPDIYVEILRRARRAAPPGVALWVNEGQVLPSGSRRDAYYDIVKYLADHDARPDGIGFMGHFGATSLTPPAVVYQVFERFAGLIPSLQLTEFDVDVGDEEQLQADYLRDIMTVAFSHPAMQGIVMWGFFYKSHWKPNAALYRADWTLKPAGQAWLDLVKKAWWTEVEGATDAAGAFRARGFLGDYAVTVTAPGGKTQRVGTSLPKEGRKLAVTLR